MRVHCRYHSIGTQEPEPEDSTNALKEKILPPNMCRLNISWRYAMVLIKRGL